MPHAKNLPSANVLLAAFIYDAETGIFTHACDKNFGAFKGQKAGFLSKSGYWVLCLNDRRIKAHRVAWKMSYDVDPIDIDHINNIKHDNRLSNLREAFQPQNSANALRQKRKITDKGVHKLPSRTKPWRAMIRVQGRLQHLGCFASENEAKAAYLTAAKKSFGEFANAG